MNEKKLTAHQVLDYYDILCKELKENIRKNEEFLRKNQNLNIDSLISPSKSISIDADIQKAKDYLVALSGLVIIDHPELGAVAILTKDVHPDGTQYHLGKFMKNAKLYFQQKKEVSEAVSSCIEGAMIGGIGEKYPSKSEVNELLDKIKPIFSGPFHTWLERHKNFTPSSSDNPLGVDQMARITDESGITRKAWEDAKPKLNSDGCYPTIVVSEFMETGSDVGGQQLSLKKSSKDQKASIDDNVMKILSSNNHEIISNLIEILEADPKEALEIFKKAKAIIIKNQFPEKK